MMTQQLGFSILSAPLAAIDRRALSQAWYSALHLAHATSAAQRVGAQAQPQARNRARHVDGSPRPKDVRRSAQSSAPGSHESKPSKAAMPERRAEHSPLARRIERTFLNPYVRPQRATFTVEGSAARVHVALQATRYGMRIVAVCPAAIRARVSRALDEARYALAVRGIALHADVSEGLQYDG